jgi:SAM-dependent methyltransferase
MIETAALPRHSYDVVTLWEVIEHLPDPGRVLRTIGDVLVPNGHIVLSTPDAGSLFARLAGRRWLGWRKVPEHLSFFDLPSLRRLLGRSGFRVTDSRYVSLSVTLGFAIDRLLEMFQVSQRAVLPEWLRKREVRVNPWYDLCVTARKEE